MSRSRDLANLGDEATGGITVSDISDIHQLILRKVVLVVLIKL